MKKNKILIILIVLLVVTGGLLLTGQHYSTLKKRESDFTVRDTTSVTKIFMADKNNHEITLKKTRKGWILNDSIKASNKKVEFLLSTLRRLRVKAPVSKASFNNVVGRMAAIAVKIEIYQKTYRVRLGNIKWFPYEKRSKVFYVGDVTQNNLGTYMLMEGAKQPYIVYIPGFRGFVSSRFSPLVDDWRSHILFHYELSDIKNISLDFGEKSKHNESFIITIENAMGNYKISPLYGKTSTITHYDTLKLLNFLTSFRDLRYESYLNNLLSKKKIDSIISSPFLYKIILVDKNNKTTVFKMFKKNHFPDSVNKAFDKLVPVDLDRFYGYLPKTGDFILLQYYTFDKILHPLSYYIVSANKKKT